MTSVIELLLETLKDLTDTETKRLNQDLLSQIQSQSLYSEIIRSSLQDTDMEDTVFLMVKTYGQQSVMMFMEILEKMKRPDLVQRLSDQSSISKKKHPDDKFSSALIHKVATMAAVQELLLETLKDLNQEELEKFKQLQKFTHFERYTLFYQSRRQTRRYRIEIVNQMMDKYGQRSVVVTMDVLMDMKRTDLVQKLRQTSSELKEKREEPESALFERVPGTDDDDQILKETLFKLSYKEFRKFKWSLQFMHFQKSIPQIPVDKQGWRYRTQLVHMMMERHGQQTVEVVREILKDVNRPDLVEMLSKTNSRSKEKHWMGEEQLPLIQKVETLAYITKLILDILANLSDRELEDFKQIFRSQVYHHKTWLLMMADIQQTVFVMVQTYGQQSTEKTKEILKNVNRNDLVQKLSIRSSGSEKKLCVDTHLSALINKVATVRAVKELLLETLSCLSDKELKKFKWLLQLMYLLKGLPHTQWKRLQRAERAEMVDLMVEVSGQHSVRVTEEVFMDMKRTDLLQRLAESTSGLRALESSNEAFEVKTTEKDKDEFPSALIQKQVEAMTSVIELLLEALADLSDIEIEDLKRFTLSQIDRYKPSSDTIWKWLQVTDVQDAVFFMVDTYGQQSVEMTKALLNKMNRADLVQKLSASSSGPKETFSVAAHPSALIQKVATMAAVKQLLLETVNSLSHEELKKFKEILGLAGSHWDLTPMSWLLAKAEDSIDVVDLMVQTYGQQSVEVAKKIFMDVKRTDLVLRLSETGSEEAGVDKHGPAQFEKAAATEAVKQILLKTLKHLSQTELEKFRWLLQFTYFEKGLSQIPQSQLELAEMTAKLVDLMVERDDQQSLEVTRAVLMDMKRPDLVDLVSVTCSRSKEQHPSSLFQKDTGDWIKLEPELNTTDVDEDPVYSLQSEAGNFECSVSGLRWSCKEKISFKYQFCSWEGHKEWMENIGYMPAGPLIDITGIVGKFDEVYLPHWICIEDNPKILDMFAVLHIRDCGDAVEKVSEVTSSHVKLSEAVFSPKAAMMKVGFRVKINCNVLIYKTNTAFLTLHIYLIPRDPALQQIMKRRESSYEYKVIRKPHPEKSLKMRDRFILTTDLDDAEICPENLKLRYESTDPNFFEIFIKNPDSDFKLRLKEKNEHQPAWSCVIRKDEYQSSGQTQGNQFVDKHRRELINRVSNIGPVMDDLLSEGVIQQEDYDQIQVIPTTQEKMRRLFCGPLKAGGPKVKDIFYMILEKKEPNLIADLKREE